MFIQDIALAYYLASLKFSIRKADTESNTFYCIVGRNDRTDEEIDEAARSIKVAIFTTYTLTSGIVAVPNIKYKIVDDVTYVQITTAK